MSTSRAPSLVRPCPWRRPPVTEAWAVYRIFAMGGTLAGEERDLPVRLQHGVLDVAERADLLLARLGLELVDGDALTAQRPVDELAAGDQQDRLALEHRPQRLDAEARVGGGHHEHRERRDHDRRAGHRVVALRDALLDQIADD